MSEVEKFYEWMEKINSVHLGNHEEMLKAFEQFNEEKVKEKVGS